MQGRAFSTLLLQKFIQPEIYYEICSFATVSDNVASRKAL